MNGNITKEGIAQDLDWMHRVGIAGFQNFDAALNTPKVVDQRLIYMQPGWQEALQFAIEKGDSYGFEMAVAGSPGWSETGGPWVKPEQAMKKVVWSTTTVEGGKPFRGALTAPPRATGPFGNLAQQDLMGSMGGGEAPPVAKDFGADTVVLALREPDVERPTAALKPTVTTSAGTTVDDAAHLYDDDLNSDVHFLAAKPGENRLGPATHSLSRSPSRPSPMPQVDRAIRFPSFWVSQTMVPRCNRARTGRRLQTWFACPPRARSSTR